MQEKSVSLYLPFSAASCLREKFHPTIVFFTLTPSTCSSAPDSTWDHRL